MVIPSQPAQADGAKVAGVLPSVAEVPSPVSGGPFAVLPSVAGVAPPVAGGPLAILQAVAGNLLAVSGNTLAVAGDQYFGRRI